MKKQLFIFVLGLMITSLMGLSQPLLNVNITFSSPPQCFGDSTGSALANATGGTMPYFYQWDDPNNTTTNNVTGLPSGTWTVTVTDGVGNTATASVTLADPAQIVVNMSAIAVSSCSLCDGEASATATGGTGALTYSWDNGQVGQTIIDLCPGYYTVTVTDQNMCSVVDSVEVLDNGTGSSMALAMSSTTSECGLSNGSATVDVTGGQTPYSYLWDDANAQTTATAENLGAGTYTVVVTDDNGCSASGEVNVTNSNGPELTFSSTVVSCRGGSNGTATVDVVGATPPYSYQWNDPMNQTTATASGLTSGAYSVVVTDNNGCFSEGTVNVTEPTEITINIATTNSTCGNADGSATANPNGGVGGYTYLWDDNAAQTTQTATDLSSGIYTVIVSDMNGCQTSASVSVNDANGPVVNVTSQMPSCNGVCDGTLTANVSVGNGPYTYQWAASAGSQTTATAVDVCGGQHFVTVTDVNGCSTSINATLNEPAPVNTNVTINGNVLTADNANADAYQWIDCENNIEYVDSIGQSFTIQSSGYYAVIITHNNCTDTSDCIYVNYVNIENISKNLVTVYPNPVNDVLYVKGAFNNARFALYATDGKQMSAGLLVNGETIINVSFLNNGIYLLHVLDGEKTTIQKIVVN